MLDMMLNSGKLFFAGKLFKDNKMVIRQFLIGVGAGVIVLVAAAQVIPLWGAAIAGGAVSGALQPYLFKDLKYA